MKTLFIIRHAKSSWANIWQLDFERPLNETGFKQAQKLSNKLFNKNILIDGFVTSTALRAKTTCEIFAETYNNDDIIYLNELYNATSDTLYNSLQSFDNSKNSIAIFAHNPGISEFVNAMCSEVNIYGMPTCGVFAVSANVKSWTDFEKAEKQFLFFKEP